MDVNKSKDPKVILILLPSAIFPLSKTTTRFPLDQNISPYYSKAFSTFSHLSLAKHGGFVPRVCIFLGSIETHYWGIYGGRFGQRWNIDDAGMVPVGGNNGVCATDEAAPSIRLRCVTSGIVRDGRRDYSEN